LEGEVRKSVVYAIIVMVSIIYFIVWIVIDDIWATKGVMFEIGLFLFVGILVFVPPVSSIIKYEISSNAEREQWYWTGKWS
jgi:hypothetical protein